MPYIPHTTKDVSSMLKSIDAPNIEALFDEIAPGLRQAPFQHLPDGLNEMALLQHANALAAQNTKSTCFIGAGSYEHHIPAAVWDIASRGEFLTAYTPYQAEASQGTLQLLYEFQTMIAELTGMDVANASLYDGATALAEAILMALRLNKKKSPHHVLVPETLHPLYRETLDTILQHQDIILITLPMDPALGTTAVQSLEAYKNTPITALIIPQPNFFGQLEPVDALTDWANAHQVTSIACVNPISLGLLKPPGSWGRDGVDIVCGEGQPLGAPMAGGGPYVGLLSTRKKYVRQMPGRLVGRTSDMAGQTGYTLTLQAREQHIRREKATSNICTNQGLLVTVATIYMSLLGPKGLEHVALQSHQNTRLLIDKLTEIPSVSRVFTAAFFHEALIQLPGPVAPILKKLQAQGISAGYAPELHYPKYSNTLLVCATECRTSAEIEHFTDTLSTILMEGQS
ncbi:MAG: aminomethyl-transferring glycine dehydrogenase subunit GcvPA [Gammaproteobacteria bacterium]|nr:aminomethyl-transferring glycine dehydrogenase subunit GcvPA [Gammaproteobacteria bacterium]MCH9763599.1 aminomethyl-transferring glycine dehydrogenase subunit GcvPA [Gammaproteobacteria bacterium]